MSNNLFTIGLLGASDMVSYSTREWPSLMARGLQVGKQSRVRTLGFGRSAAGSNVLLSEGWAAKLAGMRVDLAVLSFFADASPALSAGAMQSYGNMLTIIDMIRAARSNTPIVLAKMWRMPAAAEAAGYSNLAAVYAKYADVVANRGNISVVDCYTAWGNPALNPSEYTVDDQIHPQLAGHQRVTIPVFQTALAPLIT